MASLGPTDPFGIRAATAAVMAEASCVAIDRDAIERLAERWAAEGVQPPRWETRFHFFDGTHRSANWLLALDAVNFSFWSEDPSERWEIEYRGERLDGYWALAASFKRAVEEGTNLWDARVLADLDQGDIYRIFRGKGLIPIITDRLNSLREVGEALLERHGGQFVHAIAAANGDAAALVRTVISEFPSYADIARYRGRTVPILKRAQLLVSDLWGAYGGRGWGRFTNLEVLTAFADYKLPQLLREHGVLQYREDLARRVDAREVIPAGSEPEVEIRSGTIQACELLRDALMRRSITLLPFQVDWLLWQQSQGMPMSHAYHLTRTIYY